MAPLKRGTDKTQMSMLDFANRPLPACSSSGPPPSSTPSSQRVLSQAPVNKLPRPTAPPFFSRAPPRPKRPPSAGSPADDAWKVGEAVLNGRSVAPRVLYGDEGGGDHDSESDFEPEIVRRRVARERPSLKRKHLVSGLRDDRVSMRKRSGNRRGREKTPVKIPTQVLDEEDLDVTPRSEVRRSPIETDNADECEIVLVEGEKLEMSETEDEGGDEDLSRSKSMSPALHRYAKRPRISIAGSVVTPMEKRTANLQFKTPEEFPLIAQGSPSHCMNAPRKVLNKSSDLAMEGSSIRRRARELPRLFDSDSDDSLAARKRVSMKDSKKRKKESVFLSDEPSSEDEVLKPHATSRGRQNDDESAPSGPARRLRRWSERPVDGKRTVPEKYDSSAAESDISQPTPSSGDEYADARTPGQTTRVVARKAKGKTKRIQVASDSSEQDDGEPDNVDVDLDGISVSVSSEEDGDAETPEQRGRVVTRSATKKARRNSQSYSPPAFDMLDLADDTMSGQENLVVCSDVAEPEPPSAMPAKSSSPSPPLSKTPSSHSLSLERDSTPLPSSPKNRENSGEVSPAPEGTPPPALTFKRDTLRLSITPESTPSPPSTKKRRRLQRLKPQVSYEEEDVVVVGKSIPNSGLQETPKTQVPSGMHAELPSASRHTRGSEWFLERDIDDFSSSSDLRAPPPLEKECSGSHLQHISRRDRKHAKVSPVRRNILSRLERADKYGRLSPENTPTQSLKRTPSPKRSQERVAAVIVDDKDARREECREVVDLINVDDEDDSHIDFASSEPPLQIDDIRNSSSVPDSVAVVEIEEESLEDDGRPPPFNLHVLCNAGETVKQMKERLGEEALMDRVTEAQQEGREVLGGEELGLTASYNRTVFNRFSKEVVGDQLGRERKSKVVTERALRGEYKFNYRGRNQSEKQFRGRGGRKSGGGRGSKGRGNGRLANLRKRLSR